MAELGGGSGTSYPTTLDTDTALEYDTPSASKTRARAACVNDANAAIIAIQTALGTTPQGTKADVKTFLQVEHNTDGTHAAVTIGGLTFTATPTANAPAKFDSSARMNTNAPAFSAYLSADQTGVTDNAATKVQFNTEDFDTAANYDNATNYRFTPTVAGKYLITANLGYKGATGTVSTATISLYKNGSAYAQAQYRYETALTANNAASALPVTTIVDANGTTDYFEIFGTVDVSAGTVTFVATSRGCRFSAVRVSI